MTTNDGETKLAAGPKRRQLGRGLGALMGEARRETPLAPEPPPSSGTEPKPNEAASVEGLRSIDVAAIAPLDGQPRTHFNEQALDELAASIAARGVIQPIIVTPEKSGKYRLVAGERRWRAAQKAQLHTIPAIVRVLDPQDVMALALIENLQREDLNPVEEARAYQSLADSEGMTQAGIAKLVDKSRSHVANIQRLLALPDPILTMVEGGDLSMGHARALIGYDDAIDLAREIVKKKLSVRDVEKRVRSNAASGGEGREGRRNARPARSSADDADIAAVRNHLEEVLGLSVAIKSEADPRSGAVTIKYRTLDQLDLICQRLTGGDI